MRASCLEPLEPASSTSFLLCFLLAEAGPLLALEDLLELLVETPEGGIIARLMLLFSGAGAASSSENFPTEMLRFFRASILLRPIVGF